MTFLASLYSKGRFVRLLLVVCIVCLLLPVVGHSSILVVRAAPHCAVREPAPAGPVSTAQYWYHG